MNKRCYNPNTTHYKYYGEMGVTVCEEWRRVPNPNNNRELIAYNKQKLDNFIQWAFANGYAENLTIDRRNAHGNYCPDNCRWADNHTQAINKRKLQNKTSRFYGVYKHGNHWAFKLTNILLVQDGYFNTELDAAKAYNDYVIQYNTGHPINVFTEEELFIPQGTKRQTSSKYHGVVYCRQHQKWHSCVYFNGRSNVIAMCDVELDAAKIYNKYVMDNKLSKPLNLFTQEELDTKFSYIPRRKKKKDELNAFK